MNNIGMLINLMKNGGNPQQLAMNMLKEAGGDNPMYQNAIGMIQGNNYKGIEQMVRNLCSAQKIDPDKLLNDIMHEYGFK